MTNQPNRSAAAVQFRSMFPGHDPDAGTADQWRRVMRLAFETQNDIVDVGKRHTARSNRWLMIGRAAKARAEDAEACEDACWALGLPT